LKRLRVLLITAIFLSFAVGCGPEGYVARQTIGGAGLGAAIGSVVGGPPGAASGAAIGAAAGFLESSTELGPYGYRGYPGYGYGSPPAYQSPYGNYYPPGYYRPPVAQYPGTYYYYYYRRDTTTYTYPDCSPRAYYYKYYRRYPYCNP
jgi:hypothetical protein